MMRRLCLILLVLMLLITTGMAEQEETMNITLTIGDLVIPATLRDNAAARDLLSRLPYTVTVSRGSVDFCGEIGDPLHYESGDFQKGWEYGDFMWMPEGNWFVIFTDGIETYGQGDWIVLGHMDNAWQALKEMSGTIQIRIAPADQSTEENQILVRVGDLVRTATLSDNASARAFRELLMQGPVVIQMQDYGGFEKVGPLGTSIVRSDEYITTSPGDIIFYLGNNVTIYYDVNSWDFTLLGHIDDATDANMREFLGNGNPTVTFSLPESTKEE